MSRWMVVEIAPNGDELSVDFIKWDTVAEASYEKSMQERTAASCYPHLGYRYEVREVES